MSETTLAEALVQPLTVPALPLLGGLKLTTIGPATRVPPLWMCAALGVPMPLTRIA